MATDIDDDRRLRVDQAVQYLLNEHGGNAIDEAERALSYAEQIIDRDTIDLFQEIITYIRRLHSE